MKRSARRGADHRKRPAAYSPQRISACIPAPLCGDLFGDIALDDVADFDAVEPVDADAAFKAARNFFHVVFEALELAHRPFDDHDVVAVDAQFAAPDDLAFRHIAARDHADARDLESLQDVALARHDLPVLGREHTLKRCLDVVEELVDDPVCAHVDPAALGERLRLGVGAHVEADDDRVGRIGEHDVRFGDRARTAVQDVDAHLFARKFEKGLFDRLRGALHVALDDDVEPLDLAFRDLAEHVVQRHARLRLDEGFALLSLPLFQ